MMIDTGRFEQMVYNEGYQKGLEERPQGEWKFDESEDYYGGEVVQCTACEYMYSTLAYFEPWDWKYCPNCGAKMKRSRR